MSMRAVLSACAACVLAAVVANCASGGNERAQIRFREFASGLQDPVFVGAPRSEPSNLYVVEKPGRIRVLVNGRLRARAFLDIRSIVGSSGSEQGLFSVAFHPNYAKNHRFYVDYTDRNGDTRVVEYRSNGSRAIPSSRRQLLFVNQPFENHNGGQVAFGPDGRLYVGMGDGGSGGDPGDRAQNLRTKLGKLLRLNVERRGARWQIAAYGLRNPWRFSWDRRTGNLYIGDVGQNNWEEVDVRTPAGQRVLTNYGWSAYEGKARFRPERLNRRGRLVFPVAVYSHSQGCSVTGGYVYRGTAVPSEQGRYFYGDYCAGTVWSFSFSGGRARGLRRESSNVPSLSSFGEDASGELYAVSLEGRVYRLSR
jgi:glucose/arabinose dehydrogenase